MLFSGYRQMTKQVTGRRPKETKLPLAVRQHQHPHAEAERELLENKHLRLENNIFHFVFAQDKEHIRG